MTTVINKEEKPSDWNGGWRLLENKGQFSACDVSLTKPSLSCGNSEDDEIPQSALLEVDDNVTSMGLRLLVPPKTFWDCGYSSHLRPFVTSSTLARRVRRRLSASPRKASTQSENHGPFLSHGCA